MKFIQWLKSLFTKKESEEMSDQSVAEPAAATPAVTETPVSTDTGASGSGSAVQTTAAETPVTSSPLEQAKAKFDAFVELVEHGLEVLGKDAEADLVALKDKFL
ncbi:hypothetical protein GCM10009414_20830 [Tatumella terrea]|uniref:hypothetical protein n=1 Tax=Tatumella terrea TaxID=419007 RepID=UPI0031DE0309